MLACSRGPLFLLWLSDWKTVTTSKLPARNNSILHSTSSSLLPLRHTHTDIAMSAAPIWFTPTETLKILRLRSALDWHHGDINFYDPADHPRSFISIAMTIMQDRSYTGIVTARDVEQQYTRLRNNYDYRIYNHQHMIHELQRFIELEANREPSVSGSSTQRQSRADPEPRVHAHGSRTRRHSPAPSYASTSSTYAGEGGYNPGFEFQPHAHGSRNRRRSPAASQAPSSSTHPQPAYYPDRQHGGSQALVLATHQQPPPSLEAGQAVVVALYPAQMQVATRTTSRPRQTEGYNPRVPPPDGQMIWPHWFAGSHRSLSSILRR